jgi:hypothetical protein
VEIFSAVGALKKYYPVLDGTVSRNGLRSSFVCQLYQIESVAFLIAYEVSRAAPHLSPLKVGFGPGGS